MKLLTYHHVDNANCRIYFNDTDKRVLFFQSTCIQGHFDLLVCSGDGEPSHVTDRTLFKIDRLPGDTEGSVVAEFRTWYLMFAGHDQRIFVSFRPEAWVNDNAIEVDPGSTRFDVTREILDMGQKRALRLTDNDYPSDELRLAVEAPQWMKDWPGPFCVTCSEAIREYFTIGSASATN